MEYSQTQTGWRTLLASVFAAAIAVVAFGVGNAVQKGPLRLAAVVVMGVLLVSALLFGWLTVAVDRQALRVRFGIGLIRRTIPLTEIVSVEAERFNWLYGWGIRMTPRGWLYRASGTRAVGLTLRGGKTFFVGADDPEGLIQALRMNGVTGSHGG